MKKGNTATSFNNCILISKRGTLKETYLTECELNKEHYIKVCATPPTFEKSFKHQTTWHVKKYSFPVELWARTDGRAGQENKYEFPPPVDETLFFGECMLVSRAPFTVALWQKLYKHLFGGFDDLTKLADDDDAEIDELETVSEKKKSRDGYLKDGFIVEDSAAAAASRVLYKLKSKTKLKLSQDSSTNITIPENSGQRINIGFDEIIVDESESESSNASSASQNMNCTDNEDTDDGETETGVEQGDGDGDGDGDVDGDGDGDGDGEGEGEGEGEGDEGDGDGERVDGEGDGKEKVGGEEVPEIIEKPNVNAITVAARIAPPSVKPKPKKARVAASVSNIKSKSFKKPAKKRAGLMVDTRTRTNDDCEDTASELDEEMYDV